MLDRLDHILGKALPLITPVSLILGVLFADQIKPFIWLIPWVFAFMTFAGSLGFGMKELASAAIHPVPILIALFILHVIMPIISLGAGNLFLAGDSLSITGIILGTVIPTGVTSVIWVSVYRGHLALTLAIILVDTLLSPFLVPFSMSHLVGAKVSIDAWGMMEGLIWMVVVPSLLGMFLFHVTKGKSEKSIGKPLSPFAKIGVGIVVGMNGAVVAPYLTHISRQLVIITALIVGLSCIGYTLGWLAAKWLHWDREQSIALIYNTGMRNISAGAVIAITYFPPPVAIPVVLTMLFQQLLASFVGVFLSKQQFGHAGQHRHHSA